jgi:signal transduction histidine kinase
VNVLAVDGALVASTRASRRALGISATSGALFLTVVGIEAARGSFDAMHGVVAAALLAMGAAAFGLWRLLRAASAPRLAPSGETADSSLVAPEREAASALQARVLASERLSAVGALAVGVAHEINNPLAYVIANLSFAAEGVRQDPTTLSGGALFEFTQALAEAREGADRVRLIVQDLKTFARVGELQPSRLEVNGVLEATVARAAEALRGARLERALGALPRVEGNEGRLAQVLYALLVNAAQPKSAAHSSEHLIRLSTRTDAAGRAVVEVTAQSCLSTAPEPGRGLAVCQRVVEGMGGTLTVERVPGETNTFRLTLPPAPGLRAGETDLPALPSGRAVRVLVVDDEPLVGTAVRRTLGELHDVHIETDPRQVLARLRAGEVFDVILCDLVMPEMSGFELLAVLEREQPMQAERLVFLTAGAVTPAETRFLATTKRLKLDKPFGAAALRNLVRELTRS